MKIKREVISADGTCNQPKQISAKTLPPMYSGLHE